MLFAPQMNIIFEISTSNNPIIKFMHERGGVPQLDIYLKFKLFAPNLNVIFGITTSSNLIINKIYAWERWRTSAW